MAGKTRITQRVRTLDKYDYGVLDQKEQFYFALFCIKQSIPFLSEKQKRQILRMIAVIEDFVNDKISDEQCFKKVNTMLYRIPNERSRFKHHAFGAIQDTINILKFPTDDCCNPYLRSIVWCIRNIEMSTYRRQEIIKAQLRYLDELVNKDKYLENIVLKGAYNDSSF